MDASLLARDLVKLIPQLANKNDARVIYSASAASTEASTFWSTSIEKFVAIKKNEGCISFTIDELIAAFSGIHNVYPTSLTLYIRQSVGKSLWTQRDIQATGSRYQSIPSSSTSSGGGGSIASSVWNTGSWVVSSAWSLIARGGDDGGSDASCEIDKCDDLKGVSYFLPTIFDKLESCIVEYCNERNNNTFIMSNSSSYSNLETIAKSDPFSFQAFLCEVTNTVHFALGDEIFETGGVLRWCNYSDINLLIEYMCFKGSCIISDDRKYLKVKTSVGVLKNSKTTSTAFQAGDDPEVTKLELKIRISHLETLLEEKGNKIGECNDKARLLLAKGDKPSALWQMKARKGLEKLRESYFKLNEELHQMMNAIETALVNNSTLEVIKLTTSALQKLNEEHNVEEIYENYAEQKEVAGEIDNLIVQMSNVSINGSEVSDEELMRELEELMKSSSSPPYSFDGPPSSSSIVADIEAAGLIKSLVAELDIPLQKNHEVGGGGDSSSSSASISLPVFPDVPTTSSSMDNSNNNNNNTGKQLLHS